MLRHHTPKEASSSPALLFFFFFFFQSLLSVAWQAIEHNPFESVLWWRMCFMLTKFYLGSSKESTWSLVRSQFEWVYLEWICLMAVCNAVCQGQLIEGELIMTQLSLCCGRSLSTMCSLISTSTVWPGSDGLVTFMSQPVCVYEPLDAGSPRQPVCSPVQQRV